MTADLALNLLASLVLEDGRRWGDAATAVQWADARAVLDQSAPQRRHWISRSRGWSKTGDLAGIATAAMLTQAPAGSTLHALAADRDQGRLVTSAIAGYRARTPGLAALIDVNTYSVVATQAGTVLEVLAADLASSWGLKPWFTIVDELCQWSSTPGPQMLLEAVLTAVPKVPGARLAVITTSGDPAHWSRGVYDHAVTEDGWRVSETFGPAPWLDPAEIEAERRRLPASSFARLFENRWAAGEDRLVDFGDLRACVTRPSEALPPRDGVRYVIGVDLGIRKDRTAVAICHEERGEPRWEGGRALETTRRVVLDRLEVWSGSRGQEVTLADVERFIAQAATAYRAPVTLDPWQAIGLAQRLRSRGFTVEEFAFSQASNARLAATLHLLLRDRAVDLPDDAELLDELANVRLKETAPNTYKLEHDSNKHNDRAIALALAAHTLLSRPRPQPAGMSVYRDLRASRDGRGSSAVAAALARHPDRGNRELREPGVAAWRSHRRWAGPSR